MSLNKAKTLEGMKDYDVENKRGFHGDLHFGKHFEELIDGVFSGTIKSEIKTERDQWVKFGNMVVETASSGKPSGLTRTEADLWIHNFSYKGELVFSLMVPVDRLKRVEQAMLAGGDGRVTKGGDGWRSSLSLLSIEDIIGYLRKDVQCTEENTQ